MDSPAKKQRLDVAVADRGLAESRARAQNVIMGGGVTVDGVVVTKPGAMVDRSCRIELAAPPQPYVSRGGVKLEHALEDFRVPVRGRICLDVGASTGGFTDVLLHAGAERVYAVDVGYGQLAWTLRNDSRVIVMERTNIRDMQSLPEEIALAVVDVSFISLRLVLPVVRGLLVDGGDVVTLIKPQFEAGRGQVGKGGVVRDSATWRTVLERILSKARQGGWAVHGLARSPILGPAGNVEFLAHLKKDGDGTTIDVAVAIDRVLEEARAARRGRAE